jgi:hypothetical protein
MVCQMIGHEAAGKVVAMIKLFMASKDEVLSFGLTYRFKQMGLQLFGKKGCRLRW